MLYGLCFPSESGDCVDLKHHFLYYESTTLPPRHLRSTSGPGKRRKYGLRQFEHPRTVDSGPFSGAHASLRPKYGARFVSDMFCAASPYLQTLLTDHDLRI